MDGLGFSLFYSKDINTSEFKLKEGIKIDITYEKRAYKIIN